MNIILYDLDGTLVDSRHRARFNDGMLDLDYWRDHNTPEYVHLDHLIYPCTRILEYTLTRPDCVHVCITSRILEQTDKDFLNKHGFKFDTYLHRNSKFVTKKQKETLQDYKLKRLLLEHYFVNEGKGFTPGFAFDDLERNLDVFDDLWFTSYNADDINTAKINYKDVIHYIQKELDERISN